MMHLRRPYLSLIIPVYNCEAWIGSRLEEVLAYLDQRPEACELVVVDDGSPDDTAAAVSRALTGRQDCTLLRLARNQGKGGAVRAGVGAARGDFCVFTDCDLAYPLSEVDVIVACLEGGADIAIANRRDGESIAEVRTTDLEAANRRERNGRMLNSVLRSVGLTHWDDTQAGLKGFRREATRVFDYLTVTRFAFDIELLVIASEQGLRIESVPVRYRLADDPSTVNAFRDGMQLSLSALRIARNRTLGRYLLDGSSSIPMSRGRMVITPSVAQPRRQAG
jgi:glycosyltransferase involved in cell wall biosynthesis